MYLPIFLLVTIQTIIDITNPVMISMMLVETIETVMMTTVNSLDIWEAKGSTVYKIKICSAYLFCCEKLESNYEVPSVEDSMTKFWLKLMTVFKIACIITHFESICVLFFTITKLLLEIFCSLDIANIIKMFTFSCVIVLL